MNITCRLIVTLSLLAGISIASHVFAQNAAPNGYKSLSAWAKLPDQREWGSVSAIYPSPDGKHIWVAERCGANLCAETGLDPILLYNTEGKLIRKFGAGLIAWPHGMHVDTEGNVWVTDALGYAPVPAGWGHVIYKFSPQGELLLTLGEKGVPGDDHSHFNKPSDVLVAPNGNIFVADGHDAGGNNRIVKLNSKGEYLAEWGSTGMENGEFRDPHALAMDSAGRLFVGDRGNSRIQLFDQDGKHLSTWTQFGRPSGLYIDKNDVLYSADSESNAARNPGYTRGIRIGNVKEAFVEGFIPDLEPDPNNSGTSGAEGIAVDHQGKIYAAEVGPRKVHKYVLK